MNVGEAKKKALSLMAEYSVDGVPIPDGENADYLNRMNRFADDAQIEISDKVGIDAVFSFTQIKSNDAGFNKIDLPTNYKELRFVRLDDYNFSDFRIENGKFVISKGYDGEFEVSYYKHPTELNKDTLDTYEFEVDQHVQYLIPYYMGGMAVHDENPTIADRLLNMYFSRLQNIRKKEIQYPSPVVDTW